jgi:NAD(P)-dependent dehydrogenase (short-subunit alcohol dehydrogenase family)
MVVGATGTIGRALVEALRGRHEVVEASYKKAAERVDIQDPKSIQDLYRRVGQLDAVVSSAGQAAWKSFPELTDADYDFSLRNKLLGQVNLVRYGVGNVRDGGSFVLTSGMLARSPTPDSAAVSLVNSAVEGFVGAAALALPRGIRINTISPGWVSETLAEMGQDPQSGIPAKDVARVYVNTLDGKGSGEVVPAVP